MRDSRNLRMWLIFGVMTAALFLCRDWLTPRIQAFFADAEVASFLLYLETGRAIHIAEIPEETAVPTTAPPETEAATEPTQGPAIISGSDTVNIRDSSGLKYDAQGLLEAPLSWDLADGQTRVLIFHTHATESYTPTKDHPYKESSYYRTLETEDNMIAVGQRLAKLLEAEGIGVIQDTTFHDHPSYNGSYANARRTVKKHLEQTPSLCLLLDVHRDALESSSGKQLPTSITVDGRSVAQIMLVVGTNAGGLYNPDWQQNLALALKLQYQLERLCPGICRYISLRRERFNQDLLPGTVLVEVGAAGNTLKEALAAAEILAQAIANLSKGTATAGSTS